LENTTNFQKGQQGQCWTNQPPQMPWGYQGPWGWWNGPVNPGPMQTEEQSEGAEKHEGTPHNAAYGESNPYNYYGCPTGWHQAPPTWWNYGQYGYPYHPSYQQQYGNQWSMPYQQQYGNQWSMPYQQQYGNQWSMPYQQQYWNQWSQPYQQQYWNQWSQPHQQQSWNPYYQWWSQGGRPQVPYTQWNYPGNWQHGHAWGHAWTPGYQAWNWGQPYYGGQDAWWNPMRSACEYPIAA
jgi:hypothetical protein